jgi:hypothetical protein
VRTTNDHEWLAYADGDEGGRGLQLPSWMFDQALCATMRLSEHAFVAWSALETLKRLLDCSQSSGGEQPVEASPAQECSTAGSDHDVEVSRNAGTDDGSARRAGRGKRAR